MNAREPNLVSNVILPVSNYCPNDNNTKNIHKQTTRTYIHTHPHTHNQSINDNDNQQQQQQPTVKIGNDRKYHDTICRVWVWVWL
mmetsp:Transcript_14408/g.16350  ORF Transcript_14408/g.16350 Transcript_14408/m.16350 type:complete len:85 (+) Transcript_14408:40-294(+)